MTLLFEDDGVRDGGHVVEESGGPDMCREQVIVAQDAAAYLPGTVLKDDGSGKAVRHDGTGEVLGILWGLTDTTAGDRRAVMSARDTVYVIPSLVWADGTTTEQMETTMTAMKAAHLIGRPAY